GHSEPRGARRRTRALLALESAMLADAVSDWLSGISYKEPNITRYSGSRVSHGDHAPSVRARRSANPGLECSGPPRSAYRRGRWCRADGRRRRDRLPPAPSVAPLLRHDHCLLAGLLRRAFPPGHDVALLRCRHAAVGAAGELRSARLGSAVREYSARRCGLLPTVRRDRQPQIAWVASRSDGR